MRFRGRQAPAALAISDVGNGSGDSGAAPVPRTIRVGGQTVEPGAAAVVALPLPGRTDTADAIPVWVAAGRQPGPRVTVVAALRGFEAVAAQGASALCEELDPAGLAGGVTVAPVLRPGGRFAARGLAVSDAVAWSFPGDPGGNRRSREAFAIFSELIVGSTLLVVVTEPEAGRAGMPIVRADLDDARLRRLATASGVPAAVHTRPEPGSLGAAAREMGIAVIELVTGMGAAHAPVEWGGADDRRWADVTAVALRALLFQVGLMHPSTGTLSSLSPQVAVTETGWIRAPAGGLLDALVVPGAVVERGAVLAKISAPLAGRAVEIRARHDVLILEATTRKGVRSRAPLFLVGRVPRAVVARAKKAAAAAQPSVERRRRAASAPAAGPGASPALSLAPDGGFATARSPDVAFPETLRIGWVESVSLPALGVERLRAKIDTGARTSALHVTSMKIVGTTSGPHRRPILELTVPGGGRRVGAKPGPVRVQVREHVLVKDTSGHTERRPVIETTLRLGTVQRRIRVTLTNRGDMLFPMLIGRTALGPDVLVDPARRSLLQPPHRRPTKPPKPKP